MKNILRSLALVAIFLGAATMNAQDKTSMTKTHPDIEMYTEMYKLDAEQQKAVAAIYAETAEREAELDKHIKGAHMAQKEKMKTATPSEKENLRSSLDKKSKEKHILNMEREKRILSIFNEEQQALYMKNKKMGSLEKGNTDLSKEEMMKQREVEKEKAIKEKKAESQKIEMQKKDPKSKN